MASLLRLIARATAAVGVFAGQVLRSAHRQDLPSHNNQDPSGTFGDPDAPPLRFVLLGDSSITAPGVVPIDHSWPRRLAAHLSNRYRVHLHSVAVGGAKMRDVLAHQVPAALLCEADIALLSAGANDALRGTSISRFERETDRVLTALESRFPRVGVAGVGDLGTVPRLPQLARTVSTIRAKAIDDALRRVAARHRGVVKSVAWGGDWALFSEHPEVVFASDQFHASAVGHGIFAASLIGAVEALLAAPERVSEWPGNAGSAT